MNLDKIIIKGAREHNLKNIHIEIPKNKLIVITGVSGSGKSTLAFDAIYAEGQRRYVESLSAYARQFLQMMEKPEVDSIEGLSPAISIEQKTTSKNPRSTVGTVTEIYDYLRVLFARLGTPYSPTTGKPIMASDWSGQVDFLHKGYNSLLPGELKQIPKDSFPKNIYVKEAKWFVVNYGVARSVLKNITKNYKKFKKKALKQQHYAKKFTRDKMTEKLGEILDMYLPKPVEDVDIKLPKLKKVNLPKLKKL